MDVFDGVGGDSAGFGGDHDALLAADPIKPEEIKAAYEARRAQYEEKEQRQASHILFTVKADASDADKAKVKAHAEQVVTDAGWRFAEREERTLDVSGGKFAAMLKSSLHRD